MAAGEIAAAVTGIRAALDITKAMVGLRDAEAFRAKSIELQGVVLDAFEKAIEAREAYSVQADRIRALETEVADLKTWDAEKQKYELKPIGQASMARILKPDARGTEHPHWLCPNCFERGKKTLLHNSNRIERGHLLVACNECKLTLPVNRDVTDWAD
ncbi:hypothetical protein JQ612_07845 [Bradyrhizobium manausense]|uniref:hypothetical protein n=1 Tax=Bradyrhizobium manausense TaxID=989370 RepID=UPI001BA43EBB|nr:hypothetical protein [Bradyrhizobium manausense]MBR0722062.1 hypothetical protein [Bradyrhizobium manausense]MBR0833102.1 hypothetical protein [Bradyrhizobium manausense]